MVAFVTTLACWNVNSAKCSFVTSTADLFVTYVASVADCSSQLKKIQAEQAVADFLTPPFLNKRPSFSYS
jgi:hypothetical protein